MPRSVVVSILVFVAGCNCNASDYSFPKLEEPGYADPPTSFGSWLSLDNAPDDTRITMAYYDTDRTALGYAVGMPNEDGTVTWQHERVDGYPDSVGLDTGEVGKYASQRTAPDGTVWIAYQDSKNETLKVAHRTGPGEWEEPQVVESGGAWASLSIDTDGNPVVAHCAGAVVKLVRYDGSGWASTDSFVGAEEAYVDIDGNPAVREAGVGYTRLEVIDGDEFVAFYDAAAQSLNLLEGSGTSFANGVVEDPTDGDVGQWPSLAMDGGDLVVAYHDVGNQDLRLATRSGGSWSTSVVDDGDLRGADNELLEVDGELAVVYFDGYDNDLRLTRRSGGAWNTEVLGAAGAAIGFHNEVVFAAGHWWAGSYDYTNSTLFLKML